MWSWIQLIITVLILYVHRSTVRFLYSKNDIITFIIGIIKLVLLSLYVLLGVVIFFFITNNAIVMKIITKILLNFILNYKPVHIKDYREFKYDNPILIWQHNSVIDGIIMASIFGDISMVINVNYLNKGYTKNVINSLFKSIKYFILIDKTKKNNTEIIREFIKNNPDAKLSFAPAGGHAKYNNKIGDTFSTGAFVYMKPVSPILIRQSDIHCTWFKNETDYYDFNEWLANVLSRPRRDIEVVMMPEICPEKGETPNEFKERVRLAMIDFDKSMPPFEKKQTDETYNSQV